MYGPLCFVGCPISAFDLRFLQNYFLALGIALYVAARRKLWFREHFHNILRHTGQRGDDSLTILSVSAQPGLLRIELSCIPGGAHVLPLCHPVQIQSRPKLCVLRDIIGWKAMRFQELPYYATRTYLMVLLGMKTTDRRTHIFTKFYVWFLRTGEICYSAICYFSTPQAVAQYLKKFEESDGAVAPVLYLQMQVSNFGSLLTVNVPHCRPMVLSVEDVFIHFYGCFP